MFENDFSKTKFAFLATVLFTAIAFVSYIKQYNKVFIISVPIAVCVAILSIGFLTNGLFLKRKESIKSANQKQLNDWQDDFFHPHESL